MTVNLAYKISLSYSAGIFNVPENLGTYGQRLYFPSEEFVLRILPLKKSIVIGRYEPAKLGSNECSY
jgi:hypothetical protein